MATTDDIMQKSEKIELDIVPKNYRDMVSAIDVVESNKILGFNTYNNILLNNHVKGDFSDSESEFYNVTLNMVVKRMTTFQADEIKKKRAEYKNATAGKMKQFAEGVHPIHM